MPTDSKRKKRERKLRRELTLYHRWTRDLNTLEQANQFIQSLQAQGYYQRVALLAVLAQHGGSLEVTKGTIEQTIQNMGKLSFVQEAKKDDPNTMVVKLVEGQSEAEEQAPPAESKPALEITRIPEEEPDGTDPNHEPGTATAA